MMNRPTSQIKRNPCHYSVSFFTLQKSHLIDNRRYLNANRSVRSQPRLAHRDRERQINAVRFGRADTSRPVGSVRVVNT